MNFCQFRTFLEPDVAYRIYKSNLFFFFYVRVQERLPTPVFWPGELHGLYSPWGHKESDTTERLSLTHSQADSMSGLTSDTCTLCTDAPSVETDCGLFTGENLGVCERGLL